MDHQLIDPAIRFPIVSIIDGEYDIFEKPRSYTMARRSDLAAINEAEEVIIDSNGILFRRGLVQYVRDSNFLWGFNLAMGFRYGHISKHFDLVEHLTPTTVQAHARKVEKLNERRYINSAFDSKAVLKQISTSGSIDTSMKLLFVLLDPSRFSSAAAKFRANRI